MLQHHEILRTRDGQPSPTALIRTGPILDVEVRLPEIDARVLQEQGAALPLPVEGPALIDTGALKSSIVPSVAQSLGLSAIGKTRIVTASGEEVTRPVHKVRIKLKRLGVDVRLDAVVGTELGGYRAPGGRAIICLLGRDALAEWRLLYDGMNGSWTLERPE